VATMERSNLPGPFSTISTCGHYYVQYQHKVESRGDPHATYSSLQHAWEDGAPRGRSPWLGMFIASATKAEADVNPAMFASGKGQLKLI